MALGMEDDRTIVAPATAVTAAGVAVVRLSGPEALTIAASLAGLPATRLAHATMRLRWFRDAHGVRIDRGYVVVFQSPRSFTGQDVAELQVHGSPAVVRALVDAAVAAGARPAQPGEFSLRAFRNGRMDLVQAAALADLVGARSAAGRELALAQMDGRLSDLLNDLRRPLIDALAGIEARLDFADQEDVGELDPQPMIDAWLAQAGRMDSLAGTARAGRIRLQGVRVALAGPPNAGKSTLFNALVGADRALVHHEPGTTRDVIEVPGQLGDLQVNWLDTAGLRQGVGAVESAGVERALAVFATADVVLWLADGGHARARIQRPSGAAIVPVRTKADLPPVAWWEGDADFGGAIAVSAVTGEGLAELKAAVHAAIVELADGQVGGQQVVLARERQAAGLLRAAEAVRRAARALGERLPSELVAADLRDAVDALAEVVGEIAPDDVLAAVFSRFCIGK